MLPQSSKFSFPPNLCSTSTLPDDLPFTEAGCVYSPLNPSQPKWIKWRGSWCEEKHFGVHFSCKKKKNPYIGRKILEGDLHIAEFNLITWSDNIYYSFRYPFNVHQTLIVHMDVFACGKLHYNRADSGKTQLSRKYHSMTHVRLWFFFKFLHAPAQIWNLELEALQNTYKFCTVHHSNWSLQTKMSPTWEVSPQSRINTDW